jgi:hypothetical protein
MDNLITRLLENAFDFLNHSIDELDKEPKYSVIHFCAAMELLLKVVLMKEHWSLVVTNKKIADKKTILSGEFQSVTIDEAIQKIRKIVGKEISKAEEDAFKDVAKHRNLIMHFHHSATYDKIQQRAIVKEQFKAWYYLNIMMESRWTDVFSGWETNIHEISSKLSQHKEYLDAIYTEHRDTIEAKKKEGSLFTECPSCKNLSLEHPESDNIAYNAICLVCGFEETCIRVKCDKCGTEVLFEGEGNATCSNCGKSYDGEILAEQLLKENGDAMYAVSLHRGGEIANCGVCDGHSTVLHVDGILRCLNCFEVADDLEYCEWCSESNTGDMTNSYLEGCANCDGLLRDKGIV